MQWDAAGRKVPAHCVSHFSCQKFPAAGALYVQVAYHSKGLAAPAHASDVQFEVAYVPEDCKALVS